MRRLIIACVLALPLQAAELMPYPNSFERQAEVQAVQNHHLVSSSIRKVTGRLRAQRELWLSGRLQRQLWQLPEGHSVDEGMAHYLQQLERQSAELLFQCAGRDCGPSNLWANDVLKVAQLYGPDKDQRYTLALLRGEAPEYVLLYAIRRGNGRVLLLVDRFQGAADAPQLLPDVDNVLRLLEQRGFYDLEGRWVEAPELAAAPAFVLLRALLEADPTLNLALVGQLGAQRLTAAGWNASLEQSWAHAERVRRALIEAGIAEERLHVLGIGAALSQATGQSQPGLRLLRLY